MSGRQERLDRYRELRQRYRPDRRAFEQLVVEVLKTLPPIFREKLHNVAVVVSDAPLPTAAGPVGDGSAVDLLGLYQGTPYGERGTGYHLAAPDRITIYRRPILAVARSEADVRAEIRATVLHEVGHYFGLSDAELP